jgi:hypothetical protein
VGDRWQGNYHYSTQLSRTKDEGVIPCDILVLHIDSRVKIIDNERPGASPCDLLLVIVREEIQTQFMSPRLFVHVPQYSQSSTINA